MESQDISMGRQVNVIPTMMNVVRKLLVRKQQNKVKLLNGQKGEKHE
jgi:hypothetical protein